MSDPTLTPCDLAGLPAGYVEIRAYLAERDAELRAQEERLRLLVEGGYFAMRAREDVTP